MLIFDHSIPEIGYYSRTVTRGKELDMVNYYIQYLSKFYERYKTKKAALFLEPLIESGYPDIVIVEYTDISNDIWNDFRNKLSIKDLKILYHIQNMRITSKRDIIELLGYSKKETDDAINSLLACKLVQVYKNGKIKSIPLNRYCRINKLIAIEAKIDKWQAALKQAQYNSWFSTESFVMLNKSSYKKETAEICKSYGIGIILVNGKIIHAMESERRAFPVSYASLMFNEYIQRFDHLGGK